MKIMTELYDEYTVKAQEVKARVKMIGEDADLYDGGWRASDYEQLKAEYDLDEEEAAGICAALAELEEYIAERRSEED